MKLFDKRLEYQKGALTEADLQKDPVELFEVWLSEALAHEKVVEPYAMTLATASQDGRVHARIVLLREVQDGELTFYTNFKSNKGQELAENQHCALVFYWCEFERQVRVEGVVRKLPDERGDAYFCSRPAESRIAAWASEQSQVLPDRKTLEEQFDSFKDKFSDSTIPRPPHWGGFGVQPRRFEFWQGRPHRLHDRIVFEKNSAGWAISRLAP